MSRLAVLFGSFLLLTATGCGSIASYPMDRVNDLGDIFSANFYWGQGVLANMRGTKIVQAGVGTFDGNIASWDRRAVGVSRELRAEGGFPFYYFTTYDRKSEIGNPLFNTRIENIENPGEVKFNLTDPDDRAFYQVGVDVAAFVGVGVSVDLLQTIDFVFGIFGLDIGKDDARHQEVQPPVHGPIYEKVSDLPVTKA